MQRHSHLSGKCAPMLAQVWPAQAVKIACASAIAMVLANCAANTPQRKAETSREVGAFSHAKYGKASPRVVGLDETAPKGGGRYQVGRPYQVAGRTYVPREKPVGYTVTGPASWYGIAFHGRKTANGEIYDRNMISAAHPTMPLPSYARVTNMNNNHSIVVRVNDRGPYHGGRVLDVSERTADLLDFKRHGTARVKVDYLGTASTSGSDDTKLVASLRRDGPASAPFPTIGPTMVASASAVATARPAPQLTSALSFASAPQSPVSRIAPANNVITETRFEPASGAPLPPQRPFDLETIGSANTPVIQGRANALPKAHLTSLSFSESSGLLSRFGASHPFDGIGELVSVSDPARSMR